MPLRLRAISVVLSAALYLLLLGFMLHWGGQAHYIESAPTSVVVVSMIATPAVREEPQPRQRRAPATEAAPHVLTEQPIIENLEDDQQAIEVVDASAEAAIAPVALGAELALSCPSRRAPTYPAESRRLRQTGLTVVRAEVSEVGRVENPVIVQSSGHERLDEAAIAAVRTWRCRPPMVDGRRTRAVALQPFDFVIGRD